MHRKVSRTCTPGIYSRWNIIPKFRCKHVRTMPCIKQILEAPTGFVLGKGCVFAGQKMCFTRLFPQNVYATSCTESCIRTYPAHAYMVSAWGAVSFPSSPSKDVRKMLCAQSERILPAHRRFRRSSLQNVCVTTQLRFGGFVGCTHAAQCFPWVSQACGHRQ